MLEIAERLHRWIGQGVDVAVATVVAVSGSAPRRPGAALAVAADGTAAGSVSGGCVEAAVYELCRQALVDGESVVERFGHSEDDAFAAGLTCGGTIDVLITPLRARAPEHAALGAVLAAAARGEPVAVARVAAGPARLLGRALTVRADASRVGGLGAHRALDDTAAAHAAAFLDAGRTGTVEIGEPCAPDGAPLTLFVESSAPAPRMIVFGAIDFAAALVRVAKPLGHRVTVCDARPVFATRERFPDADEIVVDWPHRYLARTDVDARTVLCVLTHDARFDVPLLKLALRLPVAYVGAMGSRRTHRDRTARLRAEGVTEAELSRLRSPIGLDLGARTPEETALSIAAEIIADRNRGTGTALTHTRSPIHRGFSGRVGAPGASVGR